MIVLTYVREVPNDLLKITDICFMPLLFLVFRREGKNMYMDMLFLFTESQLSKFSLFHHYYRCHLAGISEEILPAIKES